MSRKIAQATESSMVAAERYADKAAQKVGKMSFRNQCKAYLFTLGIPNVSNVDLKGGFLTEIKKDYQRENNSGTISVEKWLEQGRAEPYLGKILRKLNITWEELEASLKEVK